MAIVKDIKEGAGNKIGSDIIDAGKKTFVKTSKFIKTKVINTGKGIVKFGSNIMQYSNNKEFKNWIEKNFENQENFYRELQTKLCEYIQDKKFQLKDQVFHELNDKDFEVLSENINQKFAINLFDLLKNNVYKKFIAEKCSLWEIQDGMKIYKFK